MIVSDGPNCGITYDRHYDDRNSFIIQATWSFSWRNWRGWILQTAKLCRW